MNYLLSFIFVFGFISFSTAAVDQSKPSDFFLESEGSIYKKCHAKVGEGVKPDGWNAMSETCINKTKNQIRMEYDAAVSYLSLGAYFSQDYINRPGFAKMFIKMASEERQHAMKLIEYLIMRGHLYKDFSALIDKPTPIHSEFDPRKKPGGTEITPGLDALKTALDFEVKVTKSIVEMIKICERSDELKQEEEYHFIDYLTAEFLDEQYKGQRELAGRISTLDKMMKQHKSLGEFLYDKKLLEEM